MLVGGIVKGVAGQGLLLAGRALEEGASRGEIGHVPDAMRWRDLRWLYGRERGVAARHVLFV